MKSPSRIFPKKRRLGPQNCSESSEPKKPIKIVNYATIKETDKNKNKKIDRTMWGGPIRIGK